MSNVLKLRNKMIVDLTEKVFVRTTIPKQNHPALRAGFAGYPANPRWNVSKYHAWKIGCQWREELNQGKMVVRTEDSRLVPRTQTQVEVRLQEKEHERVKETSSPRCCLFPSWAIQLVASD
jgi:hypothetical protein